MESREANNNAWDADSGRFAMNTLASLQCISLEFLSGWDSNVGERKELAALFQATQVKEPDVQDYAENWAEGEPPVYLPGDRLSFKFIALGEL